MVNLNKCIVFFFVVFLCINTLSQNKLKVTDSITNNTKEQKRALNRRGNVFFDDFLKAARNMKYKKERLDSIALLNNIDKATVSGVVVDMEFKKPISNVTISININGLRKELKTNKNGTFTLDFVPPGYHDVTAKHPYFHSVSAAEVLFEENKSRSMAVIEMTRKKEYGSIKGEVFDKRSKQSMPFINVTYAPGKGTATDFDGKFEIKFIESGEYTIEFSFVGYKKYKQNILVGLNKVTLMDTVFIEEEDLIWCGYPISTGFYEKHNLSFISSFKGIETDFEYLYSKRKITYRKKSYFYFMNNIGLGLIYQKREMDYFGAYVQLNNIINSSYRINHKNFHILDPYINLGGTTNFKTKESDLKFDLGLLLYDYHFRNLALGLNVRYSVSPYSAFQIGVILH